MLAVSCPPFVVGSPAHSQKSEKVWGFGTGFDRSKRGSSISERDWGLQRRTSGNYLLVSSLSVHLNTGSLEQQQRELVSDTGTATATDPQCHRTCPICAWYSNVYNISAFILQSEISPLDHLTGQSTDPCETSRTPSAEGTTAFLAIAQELSNRPLYAQFLQADVLHRSTSVSEAGYEPISTYTGVLHRHRDVQPSSPSPSELSPSISQSTRIPAPLAQVAAMSGSTMCHVEFSWARYHFTSSVARATTCLHEREAAENTRVTLDSRTQYKNAVGYGVLLRCESTEK